ncbi:uncharacterized protein THITE_2145717 [Thermothielavioides terrestris NRRL 8126]|uniref:Phthiocerol/phthiodiolone dimycocerosyl transferase C-terminal domain-containing protein n=1 Tax=Thermothielavioides terrestris (strain ATCC 38088 / NRRL 8126) TaxID=578455 RepID=G2R8V1_THETT|nr:uncharacterized protein THITE_2145717 [Thermothielavioides terrestris NRRL 8126]AEO68600.1 hypothetical protein THITE_2145717 [Thermothielavioides terrestris NRRL 8126]
MEWVETGPGKFRKELGGVEKVYRRISTAFAPLGREHWLLYCACTLEFPEHTQGSSTAVDAVLRGAWIALRHEFPALGVLPDGLTAKTYQVPTAQSIEEWADETFVLAAADQDPDAVLAACPARDVPRMYFFPSTQQVLLLISHWRVDGLGACMLMDRFLALAAAGGDTTPPPSLSSATSGACGEGVPDVQRISPTLEDALGAPPDTGDDDPDAEAFARDYISAHHRTAVHAGGLPYAGDAKTPPGASARSQITLDRPSTAALVAACRAQEVTVTAAVHAALAEAVFGLSRDYEGHDSDKYAAVVSVNLRPRLLPPYRHSSTNNNDENNKSANGRQHAVGVYVTGVTPAVERAQTFGEKARSLTAFYRSAAWFTPQFVRALRPIMRLHAAALFDGPPPAKPPSAVTLSSLGVLEPYLGGHYATGGGGGEGPGRQAAPAIRVRAFRFGVTIMTRQMLLYVWTFGQQLTLSVNYNKAYHDDAAAQELLERVKSGLQEGLGVPLEVQVGEAGGKGGVDLS